MNQSTAVIYAGGETPQKQSEVYDRLEDALGTIKSGIEEGYVAGGGLALYSCSAGSRIKNIIQAPYYQILKNARLPLVTPFNDTTAINVKTKKREDFIESGIIDSNRQTILTIDETDTTSITTQLIKVSS